MTRAAVAAAAIIVLATLAAPGAGAPGGQRIAFLIDSWYRHSHADVIGTRFLQGYRLGERTHASPLTIASVYPEAPRPTDESRTLAARHGFRLAGSVAEALLDNPAVPRPRLMVDGILIATREDLPETGQAASPTPRLQLLREVFRILDQTGGRTPIFIDKMLSPNWEDSRAIVAEAARRSVPLMAGSVLPYIPPERPLPAGKVEVGVVVASVPYRAFAFHAAELLQGFMERRTTRETGIATLRDVGTGYWTLPDRERWGGRVLDALLASARTRRFAPPGAAGPGIPANVVLIEYADGRRAVLALVSRVIDDREFLLGAQYADGSMATSGLVLPGEPFDHFGYLVHALVTLYTTGRAPVPVERTLLTTGLVVWGQQAREQGRGLSPSSLAVTYSPPR